MKPRSKTSRKPLKKKQNGERTTKKNTKKHKHPPQARRKKSRGMLGGGATLPGRMIRTLNPMRKINSLMTTRKHRWTRKNYTGVPWALLKHI